MGCKFKNETLSKEGEEFISNLNLYLISTGKSEGEIKEFIEEAEDHLRLGEKEGKTVKDIFGTSPEEYAKSVSNELDFDKKEILGDILLLILGFGVWIFLSKIKDGTIGFSIIECIGVPLVYIITIATLLFLTKKFVFKDKKFTISLFVLFFINIASLVVIGLISKNMMDIVTLSESAVNISIVGLFVISIIVSCKIKTYILMLPFVFYLPTIICNFFNIDMGKNILLSVVIPIILSALFIKFELKRESEKI